MTNVQYVTDGEYQATLADIKARQQAARLKRFAGKRERTFTVPVLIDNPILGVRAESWKIKGFTLADAKEQAGIA